MRLRRNQLCPIHRSIFCCGREPISKTKRAQQIGVRRIADSQNPRGYCEIRSKAEMRKMMDRKIAAQNGICALCKEPFTEYGDIVSDHISPREWEERGGTIIPTTSRPFTGGATEKRVQAGRDASLDDRPINPNRFFLSAYRPTRSNIILAKLTLSLTTAVSLGDGRLMSGSRAKRTAAMIAAAMTKVDFIRVCSCVFSPQASRSRAIALFISPIRAPLIAQVYCQVCTRGCPERSRTEDSFSSRRRVGTARQSRYLASCPPGPRCFHRISCSGS